MVNHCGRSIVGQLLARCACDVGAPGPENHGLHYEALVVVQVLVPGHCAPVQHNQAVAVLHVHNVLHTCTHTCTCTQYTHKCTQCTHTCTHVLSPSCTSTMFCTHVHTHVHTCTCTQYTHTCTQCVHTCTHVLSPSCTSTMSAHMKILRWGGRSMGLGQKQCHYRTTELMLLWAPGMLAHTEDTRKLYPCPAK
jgi:hypothetical protein